MPGYECSSCIGLRMSLIVALLYMLLLPGLGACLLRQRAIPFHYAVLGAGLLGASVSAMLFMSLAHLSLLTPSIVATTTSILAGTSLFGWRHLYVHNSPPSGADLVLGWQRLDKWDRGLIAGSALCLLIYLVDAYTPPRAADAMRYHLAQMEDIARNGRFVFRPYYHYNFPIYFTYLSLPVYFAAGGLGVKLLCFLLVPMVAAMTYGFGRLIGLTRPWIPVLGFLLTPVVMRQGTVITNDFALLCVALAGAHLLIGHQRIPRLSFLLLGFVGFGLAMGMKYQSALFLPWYLILTWIAVGRRVSAAGIKIVILLGLIAILLPAPFFVRNYVNTGVPDWPLHQSLFGAEQDYLYEVTTLYTNSLSGQHELREIPRAVLKIVSNTQILPIMWPLAAVGGWVLLRRRRPGPQLYLGLGLISFMVLWWILQPELYARFFVYLIPQFMVLAALGLESLRNKWLRTGATLVAGLFAVLGFGVLGFYSLDFLRFHIDRDVKAYHRYTWFYDEYRWINEHLDPDARLLVIVNSGHTYYLDRDYLRADPFLSGLVDWRDQDVAELRETARNLGIRYILYQHADWSSHVGGHEMLKLMPKFIQSPDVKLLWKRSVRLATSRVWRNFQESELSLIDVFPERDAHDSTVPVLSDSPPI